jgi:hypothetical protein
MILGLFEASLMLLIDGSIFMLIACILLELHWYIIIVFLVLLSQENEIYLQYSICSEISLYSRRLYPIIGYSRWPSLSVPSYMENHWTLIEIFAVVYQLWDNLFPHSSLWITAHILISGIWSISSEKLPSPLTLLHAKFSLHCFYPRWEQTIITLPSWYGMFSLTDISRKRLISANRWCLEAVTIISFSCWEIVYQWEISWDSNQVGQRKA